MQKKTYKYSDIFKDIEGDSVMTLPQEIIDEILKEALEAPSSSNTQPFMVVVATGEKLKKMESDAFKRCASKLGVGLHLWAQEQYFLDVQLAKDLNEDLKDIS